MLSWGESGKSPVDNIHANFPQIVHLNLHANFLQIVQLKAGKFKTELDEEEWDLHRAYSMPRHIFYDEILNCSVIYMVNFVMYTLIQGVIGNWAVCLITCSS